jgi:RNA-directed DNA polymerase
LAGLDEAKPGAVPEEAKQPGEALSLRWDWVERSIWTERMLEALMKGVKGGVWFSLIDKVFRPGTLNAAWETVKRNGGSAGVDHQDIKDFERGLAGEMERLAEELRTGSYRPRPIRRVYIDKPGSKEKRPLGIPCVRDRVVQAALRLVIEPIFEREFALHSYGFRPKRGCKDALREVERLLKGGYTHVVDADLKAYLETSSYYTPSHERLSKRPGCVPKTLIRKPFLFPQRRWTAEISPRFTRCNTVCRETPRSLVASCMGT